MLKRPVFAPKSLQRPRDFPSMRQDSHVSFAIHTQKVATKKKKRSKIYLSTAYSPTHLSLSLPFLTVWFLPFPFSPTSFIITSLPLRSSNLIPPPVLSLFRFLFLYSLLPCPFRGKNNKHHDICLHTSLKHYSLNNLHSPHSVLG